VQIFHLRQACYKPRPYRHHLPYRVQFVTIITTYFSPFYYHFSLNIRIFGARINGQETKNNLLKFFIGQKFHTPMKQQVKLQSERVEPCYASQ
jgi:hypothetical protein